IISSRGDDHVGAEGGEAPDYSRQDKSGSPVEHQALDMAWVQPCRSVELSAAIELFVSKVKGDFGTDRSLANSGEELG
ncbi:MULTISPECIES: hypothetical protein, partial [unclassified Bradyrhizobium]|uniref:hypothetical protein n=1 Tax=unclassified Bradyrhizobium TaxID=2631580 RepID=UPI0028EAC18F